MKVAPLTPDSEIIACKPVYPEQLRRKMLAAATLEQLRLYAEICKTASESDKKMLRAAYVERREELSANG